MGLALYIVVHLRAFNVCAFCVLSPNSITPILLIGLPGFWIRKGLKLVADFFLLKTSRKLCSKIYDFCSKPGRKPSFQQD